MRGERGTDHLSRLPRSPRATHGCATEGEETGGDGGTALGVIHSTLLSSLLRITGGDGDGGCRTRGRNLINIPPPPPSPSEGGGDLVCMLPLPSSLSPVGAPEASSSPSAEGERETGETPARPSTLLPFHVNVWHLCDQLYYDIHTRRRRKREKRMDLRKK